MMNTILRLILLVGLSDCALSQGVIERIVDARGIPSYDGTRNFFMVVDFVNRGCVWPTGNLQEIVADDQGAKIIVTIRARPPTGPCSLALPVLPQRYIIPMARLVPPSFRRDQVEVEIVLISSDGRSVSSSTHLRAQTRPTAPVPVSPGRWEGTSENPMIVDRRGTSVYLTWAHEDIGGPAGPAFDWARPGFARSWVATGIQESSYLVAGVSQLSPFLTSGPLSSDGVGQYPIVSDPGVIHAAIESPFRLLLSLPDGTQVEAKRSPLRPTFRVPIRSPWTDVEHQIPPLEGTWQWFGLKASSLRGKLIHVSLMTDRTDLFSAAWRFRFEGGAGQIRCTASECVVYSTSPNGRGEGPIEAFSLEGIGDESIYSISSSGNWQLISARAD